MYNTIYPGYVRPYNIGITNRQVKPKSDDEKNSQSSKSTENNPEQERPRSSANSYFPTGEKVAIDYTKKTINIEQVLTDFKNTTNAIGAPDDIKSEVSSYLSLVLNQAQKERPNQQIIQSNLKNASQILDEYITNTLQKPSKVVENWVDALFLQHINYKTQKNEEIIEPKEENITLPQEDEQTPQEQEAVEKIYIPEDKTLKRMFIQAKKYAAIDNKEKAMDAFEKVLDYAETIGEQEACAIVHYEKGLLHDGLNEIEEALYNYDNAAKHTNNNNIKAKAHIKMGKIYDDYVKFEPAFNHYCAAVSFAGEADNLKLQTQALADIAQIHSERYDKESAMKFMKLSDIIADETKDKKVIGLISSKNGKNCERLSDNQQALKYYTTSAKSFYDIDDNVNLAKKYESAADVMLKFGNRQKAKKLLSKAFKAAMQTEDKNLKHNITNRIATF